MYTKYNRLSEYKLAIIFDSKGRNGGSIECSIVRR